jgi:hypothetical protein
MNTEGTGFYTCKECHKTESLKNHTTTAYKERKQLGDRRNDGEGNCNSGDGMGQMAQPWMFMMMIMMIIMMIYVFFAVALRPNVGHDLILEVSRSHTTTHHSR